MLEIYSVSAKDNLISMLIYMFLTVGGLLLWFFLCRYIYRVEEVEHRSAMREPYNFTKFSPTERFLSLSNRLAIAKRGSPADRLFFRGVAGVMCLLMLWIALWYAGVTPANNLQLAYIEDMKKSPYSKVPSISAALLIADGGVYTSRRDYAVISKEFNHYIRNIEN